MRATADIRREALAASVAARVEGHHARAPAQPTGRLSPLAGIARQPVQKQHGLAVATEVDARQTDTFALQVQLTGHLQFLPRAQLRRFDWRR